MPVRLNGSTSGYSELSAPAVAGNNTLTLPTGNGSNGQFLQGNGSGTLSWSGSLTLGTAQNSTSGTSIDFTGIPSWVKRVTVMFNGVSTSGVTNYLIQVGAGSVQATGYSSYVIAAGTGVAGVTAGFPIGSGSAGNTWTGIIAINLLSGSTWIFQMPSLINVAGSTTNTGGGSVTLSGTLDRVRITTVNGTDTFDAGSINILYEG